MSNTITAGYMGTANLGGRIVRVTSFNVNPEQNVSFYDHTIGLRDSITSNLISTKGDVKDGGENPQKNIYRPSVVSVNGGLSFPLQFGMEDALFSEAKTGKDFTIEYAYECLDAKLNFNFCKVNSYTLSLTAGDVGNVSASIVGRDVIEGTGGARYVASHKLITWDACTISGIDGDIMSFNMTINNNCSYVYTSGINKLTSLKARKIRVGIQSVTGNIILYGNGYPLSQVSEEKNLTVTVGSLSFGLRCVFLPLKRDANPGVFVTSIPFVGIGEHWSS